MTLIQERLRPQNPSGGPVPATTGENDMNGGHFSTLPAANRQTAPFSVWFT
ncbi:hypothetical protein [Acetobacter orientalis]|uniref:hypothetical protein n=1 Tax=Acetobacter orientalis TaxID=146474 RepID=UPI000A5338BB|nr:hypothetical protein [Acetobacter orientalis]